MLIIVKEIRSISQQKKHLCFTLFLTIYFIFFLKMTMNVPEQFVMNMLHAMTLLVHLDVNVMKVSPVMDLIVRVKINT